MIREKFYVIYINDRDIPSYMSNNIIRNLTRMYFSKKMGKEVKLKMEYIDFKKLMDSGSNIYFDTNCFLSLYDFPSTLLENYLLAFNKMTNNIRISPRVKLEFNRNQDKIKKESQKGSEELIKLIEKDFNNISKNFSKLIKQMKRNDLDIDPKEVIDFNTSISDKEKYFQNYKELFVSNSNLKKIEKVEGFVRTLFNVENLIPEKNETERIRCIIDGYVRAKHNYPPGYMDMKNKYHIRKKKASKQNKGYLNTDDLTDYLGDYFIWTDILFDKSNKDNIFITNDLKEDWWNIPETKKIKDYTARKELIDEFSSINSNSTIIFIPFNLFTYYLTIYFDLESIESYFMANADRLFGIEINEYLIDNLTEIIETEIIDDYEVNKGLKVQDYDIEIDYVDIESFEILETNECDKVIVFCIECFFNCEGTWNVGLGLENDTFVSNSGKFVISKGDLSLDIKISFNVNEAENDVNLEKKALFEEVDYEIIDFKDINTYQIYVKQGTQYIEDPEDYFV